MFQEFDQILTQRRPPPMPTSSPFHLLPTPKLQFVTLNQLAAAVTWLRAGLLPGLATNSIQFCQHYIIKDQCKKYAFSITQSIFLSLVNDYIRPETSLPSWPCKAQMVSLFFYSSRSIVLGEIEYAFSLSKSPSVDETRE